MSEAVTDKAVLDRLVTQRQFTDMGRIVDTSQPPLEQSDPLLASTLKKEEMSDENWADDPVMVARVILDGYTYGFVGNVATAVTAAGVKTLSALGIQEASDYVAGRDYLDLRRDQLKQLEQESQAYATKHPAAALGLGLGGALLSGAAISKAIGTGLTKTAEKLGTGAVPQLINKAGVNLSRGGMPVPAAVTAANPATVVAAATLPQKIASVTQAGARMAPTLAVEGAAAGAGYAKVDENVAEKMAQGAALGVGVGLPLAGLGNFVIGGISKRRVAEALDTPDGFKPLNLAIPKEEKSSIKWIYDKILSKGYGGSHLLEQQQKRWVTASEKTLEAASATFDKTVASAKRALGMAKESVKLSYDDAKAALNLEKKAVEERISNKSSSLIKDIKDQRLLDADASVNALEATYRRNFTAGQLPKGASQQTLDELASAGSQHEKQTIIDSAWSSVGYSMVNKSTEGVPRFFRIDVPTLVSQVETSLEAARRAMGSDAKALNAAAYIQDNLVPHLTNTKAGTVVSGEALNSVRSSLSSLANDMAEQGVGAYQRAILREMAKNLENIILSGLGGKNTELGKEFAEEGARWATNVAGRRAVLLAAKKNGAFTPDDTLQANASINKWGTTHGSAPFQREANDVKKIVAERDALLKERAEDQLRVQAELTALELKEAAETAAAKYRELKIAERAANRSEAEKGALAIEAQAEKVKVDEAKEALAILKKTVVNDNIELWDRLITTTLLGGGNPALGVVVGASFATKSAQRLLAGQTSPQKLLQEGLDKGMSLTAAVQYSKSRSAEDKTTFKDVTGDSVRELTQRSTRQQAEAFGKIRQAGKEDKLQSSNPEMYARLKAAYDRINSK